MNQYQEARNYYNRALEASNQLNPTGDHEFKAKAMYGIGFCDHHLRNPGFGATEMANGTAMLNRLGLK